MLSGVGLTGDDAAVYEFLVTHGATGAAALAREVGLSPTHVRRSLAALAEAGLAHRGADRGWDVADPQEALQQLVLRRRTEVLRERQRLVELRVRTAASARATIDPGLVEVVEGDAEISGAVAAVQRSARREVCAVDAPPYSAMSAPDISPPVGDVQADLMATGIRYRVLYDRQTLQRPDSIAEIALGIASGEQARVTDVPMKLVLSDEPLALLAFRNDAEVLDRSLVVRDPTLVAAIRELFELLWAGATPLRVEDGRTRLGVDALDDDQHSLVRMLAVGLTDQEVATQTGWSLRTVGRRVADLMHQLQVQTRFQAGFRAVERGWLTSDEGGPRD